MKQLKQKLNNKIKNKTLNNVYNSCRSMLAFETHNAFHFDIICHEYIYLGILFAIKNRRIQH
jgi:hypothetical protein